MSKTAVITGATTGIGAAYAKRLATDGFDLIITGRRREIIQKLADDLVAQHGVKVNVIIAELSDDNDFQKVVDAIRATEDIEMLINNAGYSGYPRHFVETDITEHEKMIKVHQIVPMRLISIVVPAMINRRNGAIINVCSMAAFLPLPSISVYAGTKAFLKCYSECIYQEFTDKGIRVQALCPGFTNTDFAKDYYSKEMYEQTVSKARRMTMSPEKVVDYSLKSLTKDKLICIPGISNKAMVKLFPSLPMGIYRGLATRMTTFK
jgi:short-subunit dehydrogenase